MDSQALSNDNFTLYAAKHYDNPNCLDDKEFEDDLKRFKYLRRLLNKYNETGELKERLILNHIIVINNLFGPEAGTRMLFLKMEGFHRILKPFLVLLDTLPDYILNVGKHKMIISSDIPMDQYIVDKLRGI